MSRVRVFWFSLVLTAMAGNALLAQTQSNPAGTLAGTGKATSPAPCGSPAIYVVYTGWHFTDSNGGVHNFPGTSSICTPLKYASHFTGFTSLSTDGLYSATVSGGSGTVLNANVFDPDYKVVSVLYSPPGNQSTQGYTNTTTDSTTTTISSGFNWSQELTFSSGIANIISGSASWGFSIGSTNSSAYTQSWSDATSVATDDNSNSTYNPTASNAVNHNLDTFEIWLNPQVTILSQGTAPVSYTTSSLPTAGVAAIVGDLVSVPAIAMEALPGTISQSNPSGISSVPVSVLKPQAIANDQGTGNSYMPGLGAICKNNSLYVQQLANPTATVCTLANQCGCAPSDFANILAADPLLNYNVATGVAAQYPGTESPLQADSLATSSGPGSGSTVCGENPVPSGSNCRYVIVPFQEGSITPEIIQLTGAESSGLTLSDSTGTNFTTGSTSSYNVGFSFGGGPLVATEKVAYTWTWTDAESVGNGTTEGNTMAVTLKTSTAGCTENVNVFEDTLYHTFVFQIPTGNQGCP